MDPGRLQSLRRWLLAPRPRWDRLDGAACALAALLVALRWGDRSLYLMSWDAASFALGTERYDVEALRPHAPGYPVFVFLGWLARHAVPEANAALTLTSLAFTAAGVALAYGLARAVLHRAAGLAVAALLLAAPVVYVHSVTANVYTADLACSVAVAWAAWRARERPGRGRLLALAAALALAVGIRPSQVFFLAPLAAWGALQPPWGLRAQARRLAAPAALGLAIVLAWFVPMAQLSGGFAAWKRANDLQSSQIVFADTVFHHGWPIVAENLGRLGLFLRWEALWVLPPVAGLGLLGLAAAARKGTQGRQAGAPAAAAPAAARRLLAFLAAWLAPALLFYAFVFDGWQAGPSGYALVLLPGLLLAAALAAHVALGRVAASTRPAVAAALALLAVSTAAAGLAAHAHDVEDVDYRARDAWAASWSRLPESFPPTNTTIVALWNFAHAWWYFPEHQVFNYRAPGQGPGEAPDFLMVQEARGRVATPDWYAAVAAGPQDTLHPLAGTTRHLVLLDFQLAGENGGPRRLLWDVPYREAFLPDGWRVLVVDREPGRDRLEDYFAPDPGPMPPGARQGPANRPVAP